MEKIDRLLTDINCCFIYGVISLFVLSFFNKSLTLNINGQTYIIFTVKSSLMNSLYAKHSKIRSVIFVYSLINIETENHFIF